MKTQKSQIAILVLNQCSISAVFQIVRFAGDQKTALTGESLYMESWCLNGLDFSLNAKSETQILKTPFRVHTRAACSGTQS